MDSADIADKDNDVMFAEWQRKRIHINTTDVKPDEVRYCSKCGCIIPLKRLLAVPNTCYCVKCLREIENELK